MLLAYLFVTMVRSFWPIQMAGVADVHWNGDFLLTNPDGYFFAAEVKKALTGSVEPSRASTTSPVLVGLAWVVAKTTSLSLDSILFFLPLAISGLVVIPLILIGRLIGSALLGFFAAVQTGIAWAYYSRTLPGSFDTDIFALTFLLFLLYFTVRSLTESGSESARWAALLLSASPYFYPSWEVVAQAIVITSIALIAAFRRRDAEIPAVLIVFSIALLDLPIPLKLLAVAGAYELVRSWKPVFRGLRILVWIGFMMSLISSDFAEEARGHASRYLRRGVERTGAHLHQLRVEGTVQEAQPVSVETLGRDVSGSVACFAASLAGMAALGFRHRYILSGLPLVGLGFFALSAGHRFAMYLAPLAALGYFFLVFVIRHRVDRFRIGWIVVVLGGIVATQPHVQQAMEARPPTVLNSSEATVLHELGERAGPRDHVLAWWDYAYPIGYFAGRTAFLGGAGDYFILSKIFSVTSQVQSARLGRLAVETWAVLQENAGGGTVMEALLATRDDPVDPLALLESFSRQDYPLPERTREIYLYLPFRMLDIFPTVRSFSAIDPGTGELLKRPYFSSASYRHTGARLELGSGVSFDRDQGLLLLDDQSQAINSFIRIYYDRNLQTRVDRQVVDPEAPLSLVHLMSYQRILVVDLDVLNSVFFQLFFFEQYNPEIFDLVLRDPSAKVYRIKL